MKTWQAASSNRALYLLDQLHWKTLAKRVVNRLGYSVHRIDPVDRSEGERENPFVDQKRIVEFAAKHKPITVFDVGANMGQSLETYRGIFPDAKIHSFEPLPKAYRALRVAADQDPNAIANNFALDATEGKRRFNSNRGGANQTSSFLPPCDDVQYSYPAHAFELEDVLEVETKTLDGYCREQGIEHIDLLKIDVQGTELDVLRGASKMLETQRISVAYIEVLFTHLYEGDALYHHIAATMEAHGMDMFRIYQMNYGTAGRHVGGDAVFVERKLLRSFLDSKLRTNAGQPQTAQADQARPA